MSTVVTTRKNIAIQNPGFINRLLNQKVFGLLWLPIRVWLGWQWLVAGLHKLEAPSWMQTGAALKGFWTSAVAIPATGTAPIHYAWYRAFLQMLLNANAYTWFAKFISISEFMVGIFLILGAFTGLAAFGGALMNFSYMMAGSASVNPLFFALSVLLIAAWKVSGYFGADFFLVRWVGAFWSRRQANLDIHSRPPKAADA
jgi:thiosulfate dehydrogenase [quinone] large subunit